MLSKHLAIESFNQTLWKARRDSLLAKLLRNPSYLKRYEEMKNGSTMQKRYLDVMEIPTDKITGTVGRLDDFDGRFRPLKKHLRDRWVNVAVHANGVGWPPIEVFKVGEEYFVIDGHHRTSFARNNGIAFMDAKVWEVRPLPEPEKQYVAKNPALVIKHVPAFACGTRIEESGAIACGLCAC